MSTDYRAFWLLGIFEFVIGDIGTTIVGLSRGYAEAHPISRVLLENFGVYGMVGMKIVVVLILFGLYRLSPEEWQRGVPIGLFVIGMSIVTWNMFTIQLWMAFQPLSDAIVAVTDLIFT
jgi:uncharacterized membrane protein